MEFKKYHKNNEYFVRQNNSIIINRDGGRSKSSREPTTNKLSISLYYLSKTWGIWVHVPEVPPPLSYAGFVNCVNGYYRVTVSYTIPGP